MTTFLVTLHVLVCVILVFVVLLQRGKGAEIGAVFGGGASSTVFGSRGAGNFLTKLTTGAAITFMATSLGLSYLSADRSDDALFGDESEVSETSPSTSDAGGPAGSEAPAGGGFVEVPSPAPAPDASGEAPVSPGEAPGGP